MSAAIVAARATACGRHQTALMTSTLLVLAVMFLR